jgi:hypothetical protein
MSTKLQFRTLFVSAAKISFFFVVDFDSDFFLTDELDLLENVRGVNPSRFNDLVKNFHQAVKLEIKFWESGLKMEM